MVSKSFVAVNPSQIFEDIFGAECVAIILFPDPMPTKATMVLLLYRLATESVGAGPLLESAITASW